MKRRIIVNLILAFVVLQLLSMASDFKNIVTGNYVYYDARFDHLWPYLKMILHESVYPLLPVIFTLFVLLPYNLVLLKGLKKGELFSFWKKLKIFWLLTMIIVLMISLAANIWFTPIYKNWRHFAVALVVSLIFTSLHHWLVDRQAEKQIANTKS